MNTPFSTRCRAIRFSLLILLLQVIATVAKADALFTLTITGTVNGAGSITTNGTCVICTAVSDFGQPASINGLWGFFVSVTTTTGDPGDSFNILHPAQDRFNLSFDTDTLEIDGFFNDLGTDATLNFVGPPGSNAVTYTGEINLEHGTYIVSTPEPSSLILFVTVVAMLGFVIRRATVVS